MTYFSTTRSHLLLPSSTHWGPSIQTFESVGAVVIHTTTESHSSVAQAGLALASQPCVCVITAGCHMFAHSSGSLRLVADAAFCVFVKREKKKLQEVVFCKLRKFLGFIEKPSYKRSRRGLWEERWQWGVWGGYLLLTALRGFIPEAVTLGCACWRSTSHFPVCSW